LATATPATIGGLYRPVLTDKSKRTPGLVKLTICSCQLLRMTFASQPLAIGSGLSERCPGDPERKVGKACFHE
jgi:hypothetical protein